MTPVSGPTHYGSFAQVLHWLTAVLVVAAFTLGPGGSEERVYSAARDAGRQLHETLGLGVFILVLVRLAWRRIERPPALPTMPAALVVLARLLHPLLYGLLVLVPLTAIGGAWLEGHPLTLLGGLAVPPPMAAAHATGEQIARLHPLLGDTLVWLAGFHAVAALFHHFVLRDRVLLAMLPARVSRESRAR